MESAFKVIIVAIVIALGCVTSACQETNGTPVDASAEEDTDDTLEADAVASLEGVFADLTGTEREEICGWLYDSWDLVNQTESCEGEPIDIVSTQYRETFNANCAQEWSQARFTVEDLQRCVEATQGDPCGWMNEPACERFRAGVFGESSGPSCSPDSINTPGSDDAPLPSSSLPTHIPSTCDGQTSPHVNGTNDTVANGTLILGDEVYQLDRAAQGFFNVEDLIGERFSGYSISFVPSDACFPEVILTVIDAERYDHSATFEVDLSESLCPGSALYNTSVQVRLDPESCLMLSDDSSGTFSVLRSSETNTAFMAGSISTTMMIEGVEQSLQFDYNLGLTSEFQGVNVLTTDDLCASQP